MIESEKELITLGRAIREVRDERSMDPDDLSAAAGIERVRLDAIEAGRAGPPYDVMLALARGLCIEPVGRVRRAGKPHKSAKGSAFGRRLRKLRHESGVSQERLARYAGLHRTAISKLELGERDPRLATILRLARGIGVPPEAFVTGLDATEDEPGEW